MVRIDASRVKIQMIRIGTGWIAVWIWGALIRSPLDVWSRSSMRILARGSPGICHSGIGAGSGVERRARDRDQA